MDQESRDVQQEIERTLAALAKKIEMLETQMCSTVEGKAAEAAQETVDWLAQLGEQKWKIVGALALAGYLVGRLTVKRPQPSELGRIHVFLEPSAMDAERTQGLGQGKDESPPPGRQPQAQHRSRGWLQPLHGDATVVKGVVAGAMAGVLADLLREAVPLIMPYLKQALGLVPASSDRSDDEAQKRKQ